MLRRITPRCAGGKTRTMPLGNEAEMGDERRDLPGRWIRQRAEDRWGAKGGADGLDCRIKSGNDG